MDFYIDPGGPGSHPGGSRTDPEAETHQKNENKNLEKCIYIFPPRHHKITIIIFRRATTMIMAAGRQKDEFYSYIGRLRHGPNSIKNQ